MTDKPDQNDRQLLEQATLKHWLWYEPDTGVFRWRFGSHNGKVKPWGVAGSPDNKGHIKIELLGKMYRAHRLAWLYMTGNFPSNQVDHKNLIKSDNSWVNLREANANQNQWNTGIRSDNKSGVKGVHFCKTWKRWIASVRMNGVRHHIGRFVNFEDAVLAVTEFRKNHHGEFAR